MVLGLDLLTSPMRANWCFSGYETMGQTQTLGRGGGALVKLVRNGEESRDDIVVVEILGMDLRRKRIEQGRGGDMSRGDAHDQLDNLARIGDDSG